MSALVTPCILALRSTATKTSVMEYSVKYIRGRVRAYLAYALKVRAAETRQGVHPRVELSTSSHLVQWRPTTDRTFARGFIYLENKTHSLDLSAGLSDSGVLTVIFPPHIHGTRSSVDADTAFRERLEDAIWMEGVSNRAVTRVSIPSREYGLYHVGPGKISFHDERSLQHRYVEECGA